MASVLAYLSTPDNGYCSHSLELMTQLRLTYPDDSVLMQNVEDNEATCRSLMGTPPCCHASPNLAKLAFKTLALSRHKPK